MTNMLLLNCALKLVEEIILNKYSCIPTRHRQCLFTFRTRHLTFRNGNVYIPSLGAVLLFVLPLEPGTGARVVLLSEFHVG